MPLLFDDLKTLKIDTVKRRSIEKLRRDLGPIILEALQDTSVTEIMLNPNQTIWIEDKNGMRQVGEMTPSQSESLIKMVASCVHEEVGKNNPLLECELPYHGARFEGILPPVVHNPSITIRKHSEDIYTLNDYVASGILSSNQHDSIVNAVTSRKNILVAGSTGSGKTTFANAVIKCVEEHTPDHRLVIIEDTNELQVEGSNNVTMRSNADFSMLTALKATMRLRPDRIIVGEVRGGEALTLLKAFNTGHNGGLLTLHANSASAALVRLEQLISEASATPMNHLIAEAIDLIIFMEKEESHPAGRVIKEIAQLTSYTDGQYKLNLIGD